MRKINYRITVNITQKTMKLGFRAKMPEEMEGKRIRVQAVFTQRQVERRFPMEVVIEEGEVGEQIRADAEILLPYVFYSPPRHKVNVVFALWCGAEEISLDDQPFPVQKELFARAEIVRKRNLLKFAGCSLGLPFLLVRDYFKEGKNFIKAAKRANETVYRISGYNYSARQQNTDYFAARYRKYVAKNKVKPNQILFLSEREPEEGGNLMLVKKWFEENEPEVEIATFINTKTVDQLKKRELRECALKCATSAVIILEDFYPQLHSIHKRNETKIIQLWHACGAFKTFGLTRMGKKGGAPQTSMNHRNYDLVPVSSDTVRDIYAEAFGISPSKVQALGVPRTDRLFDWEYEEEKRRELYEKYPAFKDNRVILFAPTFRGDGNKDAHYPPEAFDVNRFMERQPEDTVLILKNHPFVKQSFFVEEQWKDRVFDLSTKEHINDLMLISNLLITDYSSSVFEAAILELPMLFYAFDEKEYMDSRDFYFDYDQFTPGPVVADFEALCEKAASMLENIVSEVEQSDLDNFRKVFLNMVDGHSTERICRKIKTNYINI